MCRGLALVAAAVVCACTVSQAAGASEWSSALTIDPKEEGTSTAERIEAAIEDGLLHVRRLDPEGTLMWSLILGEASPSLPPSIQRMGPAIEVRHANGYYFVRDTFWGSTIAAFRQRLGEGSFTPLDTSIVRGSNSIDRSDQVAGADNLEYYSIANWEKDGALWVATGPARSTWHTLVRLSPNVFVPQSPRMTANGAVATMRWDEARLMDNGEVLVARYVTAGEAEWKLSRHKLVKGSVPLNIDSQRWVHPETFPGGEPIERLGWFKGKVVLLYFWATWSEDSRDTMALVEQLRSRYGTQDLVVIGVHSSERSERLDAALAEAEHLLPVALDTGETFRRYGIGNLPQFVLLGRDGMIAWASQNGEPPTQRLLEDLIDDTHLAF